MAASPIAGWTWRGRLGVIFAGLWFVLEGLVLFGVNAPAPLMAVLALVAGVCLLLGL